MGSPHSCGLATRSGALVTQDLYRSDRCVDFENDERREQSQLPKFGKENALPRDLPTNQPQLPQATCAAGSLFLTTMALLMILIRYCFLLWLTVFIAWLALPTSGIFAQGTTADYERMSAQGKLNQQLVDRGNLSLHWLADDRAAWYRVQARPDLIEYHLVDPRSGTNRRLFDTAELVQQTEQLGHSFPVDALNRLDLLWDEDLENAYFELDEQALAFNLTEEKFRDIEIDQMPESETPDQREVRPSGGSSERIHVTFQNHTEQELQLFWIDTNLRPRPYEKIPAGESIRQNTFAGHNWLVRDSEGRNRALVSAQTDDQVAIISQDQYVELTVSGGARRRAGFYLSGNQDQPRRRRDRRQDNSLSPDGNWRASVQQHNILLIPTDQNSDTAERVVTDDGTQDHYYTDRVYWSPDSRFLMVIHERPAQSHPVHIVESSPDDQLQPKLHTFDYLKPGDRIRTQQPKLYSVEDQELVPVDDQLFSTPWQLSDLQWLSDSSEFLFRYNQRGHQVMRVIGIDTQGSVRAVVDEVSETFIDYTGKSFVEYLVDSNEIIWASERSGWNHLYRYDLRQGTVLNPITHGSWVVRDVRQVDAEKRQIWFTASGVYPDQDPYQIHYGRVDFDGQNLTWLTQGDGNHAIEYSPTRQYVVDSFSRMDLAPVHELRRSDDGTLVCELERADWSRLKEAGWQPPEPFQAKGRDGETDIYGVIYRPQNFDPQQRYPVIEYIYAGPQDSFVPKSFSPVRSEKSMAELGFIVVQIDGMGTSNRSKAFHDVCWKNLGDGGFPDRIAWMKAAAEKYPQMDLQRVGIYGGSAGGQNALRALLAHPDFYRAGVADCGCHDNRMDKIWWNEQWMGWPIGDHYQEQSNVTQAHRLQGNLLLMVGEMDRNVDPASTMQVVDALIEADKDFELIVFPGGGHGSGFGKYGRRRMCDFFVRHLLGVQPRAN